MKKHNDYYSFLKGSYEYCLKNAEMEGVISILKIAEKDVKLEKIIEKINDKCYKQEFRKNLTIGKILMGRGHYTAIV